MIISKTPVRISFFSGGSDIKAFYERDYGAALSVTIDKFIYVMMHYTTNGGLKAKFDIIENVHNINDMHHILTREALNYYMLNLEGLEISSISDISYRGCGLGTSSAFTVGLVNVIMKYLVDDGGYRPHPTAIAERACDIEINRCEFPIGKQDQYSTAHGGLNQFLFFKTEKVEQISLSIPIGLQEKLLLVYSGKSRNANDILKKQAINMSDPKKFDMVRRNRDRVFTAVQHLKNSKFDDFGALLGEAWEDKKKTTQGISNHYFDDIYNTAIKGGALGGKVLGAGGGGFFLFYCPTYDIKANVVYDLKKFELVKPLNFKFVEQGSAIVYRDDR